jgi:hypothetical protein
VTQELPKCTAGTQTASCLTDAQADALRVIYGGLPSTGGTAFP